MLQMIWRWKAWENAKRFSIYYFSQFIMVLCQFWKWIKKLIFVLIFTNFIGMGQIIYHWKATENAKLSHVDGFLWFLAVFKLFRKRQNHSFYLYRNTDSSKMHHVKNLSFSACLLQLHSVFHVLFLLAALQPLTGTLTRIKQVIYRWKADVNTQLSRVDRFFIHAAILKVFHLKFIQCSSWTSCCFHVELLWRIFVCNFLIRSLVLHNCYSFCTDPSHNNFF